MRRTLGCSISFALMLVLGEKAYPADRAKEPINRKERLLPFTTWFDPDVRPILERKLLVTPANYGRMIRMYVPNTGEYAISIYSAKMAGSEKCYVTLTKAQANLDYTMNINRGKGDPLRQVRNVEVARKDAEIPCSTAEHFRRCLRALLPEGADRRVDPTVATGFDRIEFWLCEQGVACQKSDAPIRPGKRIAALIRMADLLVRYCEAKQASRGAIAKEIENTGDTILSAELGKN